MKVHRQNKVTGLITSGMKSIVIKYVILFFFLTPVTHAGVTHSETKFPVNIVIEYNNEQLDLVLTGLTIRKKFFLKIYSMAHYIEQKSDVSDSDTSGVEIYKNILLNNDAKQISIIFLRALSAKQIQKSLISGIKLNSSEEEYLLITPQVDEFIQAIDGDVEQGDEFIIRWLPDSTLVSIFQGEQISAIKNHIFAKTLWSIWFGNDSIVDRKSLIKELLSSS